MGQAFIMNSCRPFGQLKTAASHVEVEPSFLTTVFMSLIPSHIDPLAVSEQQNNSRSAAGVGAGAARLLLVGVEGTSAGACLPTVGRSGVAANS